MDDSTAKPPASHPQDVTGLLLAWRDGDAAAFEQLIAAVYAELRQVAHRELQKERPEHTLLTADLGTRDLFPARGLEPGPMEEPRTLSGGGRAIDAADSG